MCVPSSVCPGATHTHTHTALRPGLPDVRHGGEAAGEEEAQPGGGSAGAPEGQPAGAQAELPGRPQALHQGAGPAQQGRWVAPITSTSTDHPLRTTSTNKHTRTHTVCACVRVCVRSGVRWGWCGGTTD